MSYSSETREFFSFSQIMALSLQKKGADTGFPAFIKSCCSFDLPSMSNVIKVSQFHFFMNVVGLQNSIFECKRLAQRFLIKKGVLLFGPGLAPDSDASVKIKESPYNLSKQGFQCQMQSHRKPLSFILATRSATITLSSLTSVVTSSATNRVQLTSFFVQKIIAKRSNLIHFKDPEGQFIT